MKKLQSILFFLLFTVTAFAGRRFDTNGGLDYKSVAKINLYSLTYKTLSAQYEYVLGAKTSVALGLRYTPSVNNNRIINSVNSADPSASGSLQSFKIGGYAITPEFRFYLSKQAGKGFYMAPFARLEKQSLRTNVVLVDGNTSNTADLKGSLGGFGGGLLLGTQFSIGQRVTLDWWIAGAYYKAHTLKINSTNSAGYGLSTDELNDINDAFSALDNPLFSGFSANITNNSFDVSAKTSLPGIRTGLCLGYRL